MTRRFGSKTCQIPLSTWSLRDLKLTAASSDLISRKELEVLAQRALLDLPDDTSDLQYHLSNMLHCIDQVENLDLIDASEQDLYDNPRGLKCAPARPPYSGPNNKSHDEEEEANLVWDNYLHSRTTKHGDHEYFEIITQKLELVEEIIRNNEDKDLKT